MLDEIIGFLIVIFILFFPLLRRLLIRKKPPPRPLQRVEEEEVSEPEPPSFVQTPHTTERTVTRDFEFHARLEDFERTSKIEEREVGTRVSPEFKKTVVSEAFAPYLQKRRRRKKRKIPLSLEGKSLKRMVIYNEILGRPKGDG